MPLIFDIQNAKIPYIIVPRCSLTASALKKKRLKKRIGNMVYFNRFIKNAAGIQYLTDREKEESGDHWNKNGFVIPNGITVPDINKTYHSDRIEMTFIGRIDVYHKGLDLLLEVCHKLSESLKTSKVHISLYGSGKKKDVEAVKSMINRCSGIVDYMGPVQGYEKHLVLMETDVFLLTSRFEGMPMGVLEALSYRIPIMITNGTNMAPVVEEYDCGWCDDVSEEGISKLFQRVMEERDLIAEKGEKGINAAYSYDWNTIAQKTHRVLESIVEKG